MKFPPFDITTPHVIYALLGAFTVLFGMFSLLLREKLYMGEAMWAFIFGIIIGPYGANVFDPRSWGDSSDPERINLITHEFTRVVLGIGVFAVGVELPKAYMLKHWKTLFFLLVPVMTWGWLVCAGLIYALIPGLNFLSSLAVSACLTPTDPILASAVVRGRWADKHVPAHIRHLLGAESGCSDGAAFLVVFFALYLMADLPSVGEAMKHWFLVVWLYEIILGILIGSLLGFSFRHLMKFCQRHDLIDRQSYVAQYLTLAILTIGLTTLLGTDDLLASFACGISFAWDGFFNKQTEESVFSSVVDVLFNAAAFIFVGAWMPFGKFQQDGSVGMGVEVWRLVVLAILVLLLRRLPIMMGLSRWIPDVKTWREAVFIGHFGPMGIGAIFISTLAYEFLHHHVASHPLTTTGSSYQRDQIEMVMDMVQPIVAFMVLFSVAVHGLSIPGFSLGRRVHSVTRTWSRRDTIGSGPDWTNNARLITKGEDIVINRDLEKGGEGGVPLERTMTMMSMGTLYNYNADEQKEDVLKEDIITEEAKFQVHSIPAPTPIFPTHQAADQEKQDHPDDHHDRNQFPPDGEHLQTSKWIEGYQRVVENRLGGFGDDVEVTVIDESPNHRTNENAGTTSWTDRKPHELERGAEEIGDSMRDGVWRTFNLGRRRDSSFGGGGIPVSSPARGGGNEVGMENRTRMSRPTTADTLVADENIDGVSDESHYSQEEGDTSTPELAPGPAIGGDMGDTTAAAPVASDSSAQAPRERRDETSSSVTRLPSRIGQNQQFPLGGNRHPLKITTIGPPDNVNLNLDTGYPVQSNDNYDSDAANASNANNEIIEVPRGREGRLVMNQNTTTMPRTMSGSSLTLNPRLGMGRMSVGTTTPTGLSSTPPISPCSSSILPTFPSPTVPLQYSPHPPPASHSRPRTAPTSPTTSTTTSLSTAPPASTPISRPATADSNSPIRRHRLDSILANSTAHIRQRTLTRESSVRFVDYVDGESGYVGPLGPVRDSDGGDSGSNGSNGSPGNGGRTVLVVEIPPPPPRSYSFSKDKDGNGRTLVDSPLKKRDLSASHEEIGK